jgi:hypothetical protein
MKNFFKGFLTAVTREKQHENKLPLSVVNASLNSVDQDEELLPAHSDELVREERGSLVKSRYSHYTEQRYAVVSDPEELKTAFMRLKGGLFKTLGVEFTPRGVTPTPGLRIETGLLPGNNPYMYFDPWDRMGWLIEQTHTGFSIAPADKIVERNTFMRGAVWDVVTVYRPDEQIGLFRLSSQRSGERLVSLAMYQEYLLKELGLSASRHS